MTDRVVTYRLRAELGQLKAQFAQGSASAKKFADDLTAIDREGQKARRGLDTLASAAGKIGLVAAAGLGAAVVASANFDQAMSNVAAATHESTENMEALRSAALEAGASTVFSATEAASAVENLAKAGISTADILGGGLQGALDLAAAGSLEVADAAEIAATALTQFGLSGEDVPHVADLLAAGAGKAQGEVTDLAFALKQSGLVAAQMGISIEETTGALSAFASAGLLGSDAGTSFRTMLLRLANPTKESKDLMDALGIAAYDMQGNFVGIESLAGQLQTAFQGQTQATRDAALATIFGSDSIRAANVLYEQGAAGIAEWTDKVDDTGFAAETAATKLDNLKGDLEELRGAFETALIGTGDGAQGPLRKLTQGLTDVINKFNDLPPAAQNTVTAFLGITAITGGGLWFGSKVIQGVANTRQALDDLGTSGGKASKALGGLTKAGGAVAAIFALDAALQALNDTMEASAPRGEELQTRLLDLSDGRVADLGKEFDSLAKNLEDIGTGGLFDVFQGADAIPGIGESVALLNNALPGESTQERFREFKDQLDALDASLAGLVASGGPEAAEQAFADLAASMSLSATGQEELLSGLPSYRDALAGAANDTRLAATETDLAADSMQDFGSGTQITTESIQRQRDALKEQKKALQASREAAADSAETFVNLGDSLDDGKKSLKQWIKEMENQADALANFRKNSKEAAKKGLDEGLIASLQEAGEAGALRMRQLANATDSEIKRANKAWREGQAEIRKYVKETTDVPKKKTTEVEAKTAAALHDIGSVASLLKNLDGSVATTYIDVVERGRRYGGGAGPSKYATGGRVRGPGSATSDSIPAWLSNGEFVIKAAAVSHYGPDFFHKLNAMRLAGGGMVGRSVAPSVTVNTGQSWDYDRIADAILRARPTYGPVTVLARDMDDFKRQERQDRQAAGLGGIPA